MSLRGRKRHQPDRTLITSARGREVENVSARTTAPERDRLRYVSAGVRVERGCGSRVRRQQPVDDRRRPSPPVPATLPGPNSRAQQSDGSENGSRLDQQLRPRRRAQDRAQTGHSCGHKPGRTAENGPGWARIGPPGAQHNRTAAARQHRRSEHRKPRLSAGFRWSGRRDSNPRPQPWQGCALPAEPRPRGLCTVAATARPAPARTRWRTSSSKAVTSPEGRDGRDDGHIRRRNLASAPNPRVIESYLGTDESAINRSSAHGTSTPASRPASSRAPAGNGHDRGDGRHTSSSNGNGRRVGARRTPLRAK
jgi:hypothetical protein